MKLLILKLLNQKISEIKGVEESITTKIYQNMQQNLTNDEALTNSYAFLIDENRCHNCQ